MPATTSTNESFDMSISIDEGRAELQIDPNSEGQAQVNMVENTIDSDVSVTTSSGESGETVRSVNLPNTDVEIREVENEEGDQIRARVIAE